MHTPFHCKCNLRFVLVNFFFNVEIYAYMPKDIDISMHGSDEGFKPKHEKQNMGFCRGVKLDAN